jgi:hypothetical protein
MDLNSNLTSGAEQFICKLGDRNGNIKVCPIYFGINTEFIPIDLPFSIYFP